jgi:hypothetical protein
MNSTDFQSVLAAMHLEQEQRFVQLLDALRVGHGTSATVAPLAQGILLLPQLSDIESFVVDVENPTHFDDWLRWFDISLMCAAPEISEKEKTMVLATKLSTDAFAKFRKCCLLKEVTNYSYEQAVARLRICRPLQVHASYSGRRGRVHRSSQLMQSSTKNVQVRRAN